MFAHFTIYHTEHNPPKHSMYRGQQRFSIAMGFQNADENEFNGFGTLVVWLWRCF